MRALVLALALLAAGVHAQDADYRSDLIVGVQTPEGEPIPGATVLVGDRGASTDAEGEATIEGVAQGRYRVRVSFLGYQPRELAARLEGPGPWGVIVEMAESRITMNGVVVEARDLSGSRLAADGFFDRLDLGAGTVLNVEDLRRRNPVTLTDALRGVLGVRIRRGEQGPVAISQNAGSECALAVFLDGVPYRYASENLDAISAQNVVAVEVYRRPSQVPLQYNQLGVSDGCGVALVWTELSLAQRG